MVLSLLDVGVLCEIDLITIAPNAHQNFSKLVINRRRRVGTTRLIAAMSKRQKTQEDGGTPRVPPAKIPVGSIPRETRLFINNEWVAGHGKKFDTINPATEAKICTVDSANAADVDKAVAAATAAFKTWSKGNGCDRRDCLLKLAALVEKHREQLAEVESLDNGKPVHVADAVDIGFVIEVRTAALFFLPAAADRACFFLRPSPVLQVLRGMGRQVRRQGHPPDARLGHHLRVHDARADRRVRLHHPVELPAADAYICRASNSGRPLPLLTRPAFEALPRQRRGSSAPPSRWGARS